MLWNFEGSALLANETCPKYLRTSSGLKRLLTKSQEVYNQYMTLRVVNEDIERKGIYIMPLT